MIISCNLSKAQQAKLKKIVKTGTPDKVRLTKSQLEANSGQHFIKLNMEQTKQAMSALNRKKGMDLMLTKEQLLHMNQEQSGGFFFLPFLLLLLRLPLHMLLVQLVHMPQRKQCQR